MIYQRPVLGGVAALIVFGLGNVLAAFCLPAEMHDRASSMIALGFITIGIGIFAFSMMTSRSESNKFLVMALGASVLAGTLFYCATKNEFTGTAKYRNAGRYSRVEFVTRENSPVKFRQATDLLWGWGILSLGIAALGYTIHYKAEA